MVRLANRRSLFVGVAALFVCLTAVAQENASWSEQKIGNLWSGGTPVWSSATAAGRSLIDAQVAAWQIQYGKQLTPQTALSCSDFGNDQGSCSQTYTWVNDCCGPPNPIVTAPFGVRIYAWCQQSSIGNDRYGIQTGNLTYTCPREGGPCSVYPANSTFGCGKTVTDLQNIAKAATDPTRIFHATQTCIAKNHATCGVRWTTANGWTM